LVDTIQPIRTSTTFMRWDCFRVLDLFLHFWVELVDPSI
jgi:hypothetical protein